MLGQMPTNVGTFTIWTFGDPAFLVDVLDAVASIKQSGLFGAMGGVLALLGMLLMIFQSVAKGGKTLELGEWFAGVLLYLVMFGPGATVQVQSVMNTVAGGVTPVQNVPLGVATVGAVVTAIGKRVTELTTQAFSSASGSGVTTITKGGAGRSLAWLATIRSLYDPTFTNPFLQRLRETLGQYVAQCTTTAFQIQPQRASSAPVEDVLDVVRGYGYDSEQISMSYTDPATGVIDYVTCKVATDRLNAIRSNGDLLQQYIEQAGPKIMPWTKSTAPNGPGSVAEFQAAMGAIGESVADTQRYMFASVLRGVLANVSTRRAGDMSTPEGALWAMVAQSTEQTATDMVGQETRFLKSLPYLVTFLEALLYCATPFMAALLLMGRAGMTQMGKLLFIPAFVAAWYPAMAIIDALSVYLYSEARDRMLGSIAGSIQASWEVTEMAMNAVATSSMLMASTPVIALFLLTGGAYVTTTLASRMSGVDRTTEKIASPDAIQNDAAMVMRPYTTAAADAGPAGNVSVPTVGGALGRSQAVSMAAERVDSAITTWSETVGRTMENALSNALEKGLAVESAWNMNRTRNALSSLTVGTDATTAFRNAESHELLAVIGNTLNGQASADLKAGANLGRATWQAVRDVAGLPEVKKAWEKARAGKLSESGFRMAVSNAIAKIATGLPTLAKLSKMLGGRVRAGMAVVEALAKGLSAGVSMGMYLEEAEKESAKRINDMSEALSASKSEQNSVRGEVAYAALQGARSTEGSRDSNVASDKRGHDYRRLEQEGSGLLEKARQMRTAQQTFTQSANLPITEVATYVARLAADGDGRATALIDMLRDLPKGALASLESYAQRLSPNSQNVPGGPPYRSALMAVSAAVGLGGVDSPDAWKYQTPGQRESTLEMMQEQLAGTLAGLVQGTDTVGEVKPGEINAPGFGEVGGAGVRSRVEGNVSKVPDPEETAKRADRAGSLGPGTGNSGTLQNEVQNVVEGGIPPEKWPTITSGEREEMDHRHVENARRVPGVDPTTPAVEKLHGMSGEPLPRNPYPYSTYNGTGRSFLEPMADAFLRGEGGVTRPAPSRDAAEVMAAMVMARTGLAAPTRAEANRLAGMPMSLNSLEAEWVREQAGLGGGKTLHGVGDTPAVAAELGGAMMRDTFVSAGETAGNVAGAFVPLPVDGGGAGRQLAENILALGDAGTRAPEVLGMNRFPRERLPGITPSMDKHELLALQHRMVRRWNGGVAARVVRAAQEGGWRTSDPRLQNLDRPLHRGRDQGLLLGALQALSAQGRLPEELRQHYLGDATKDG